jgi:hypothetical protein
MSEAVSSIKNPIRVRAGQMGAAKRWSNPANRRVVRLHDLTPEQRRLVLALVEAARSDSDGVKAAA